MQSSLRPLCVGQIAFFDSAIEHPQTTKPRAAEITTANTAFLEFDELCRASRQLRIFDKMKHAGQNALDEIEPLLGEIRGIGALREPKRRTFYRGASAFLHFHEDPAGIFADIKRSGEFVRMRVSNMKEPAALIRAIRVGAEAVGY